MVGWAFSFSVLSYIIRKKGCGLMLQSTLCYLERGGAYLMLHRVKKEQDANRDK